MTKSKKTARHRHAFRFHIEQNDGKVREFISWAKVFYATKPVALDLKADHVRRSIKLGGIGNTQNCSMAVCAISQKDKFPHPVEGHIDWTYGRAYVVTALGKDGLPSKCVCYTHWDAIARMNDTKGGQTKLLADLEANGDRHINLLPYAKSLRKAGRPPGKNDGTRKSRPLHAKEAKLRYGTALLGGAFS